MLIKPKPCRIQSTTMPAFSKEEWEMLRAL